jgi:hypothetical protein
MFFVIPVIYITLSYYFINDQFVPQFFGLIYLIVLFGFYNKYRETEHRLFFIFIVIFYTLTVCSHPFMFIFFIIAILVELIWTEYIYYGEKLISYEMIIVLFSIPSIYLTVYLQQLRQVSIFGGSSKIFGYIFSEPVTVENGLSTIPLYHLIPVIYDQILTNLSKLVVAGVFAVVTIGFLIFFLEKRRVIDLGIVAGSLSWFIMGFFNIVLGERALQVTPLALANHFKQTHKIFSYLSMVVLIFILIFPFLGVTNTMVNESIAGERLVQDNEENIAGRFFDDHINGPKNISAAQNAYPTGVDQNGKDNPLRIIMADTNKPRALDFVILSSKYKLMSMYYNIRLKKNSLDSVLYKTQQIEIFSPHETVEWEIQKPS